MSLCSFRAQIIISNNHHISAAPAFCATLWYDHLFTKKITVFVDTNTFFFTRKTDDSELIIQNPPPKTYILEKFRIYEKSYPKNKYNLGLESWEKIKF